MMGSFEQFMCRVFVLFFFLLFDDERSDRANVDWDLEKKGRYLEEKVKAKAKAKADVVFFDSSSEDVYIYNC